MRYRVVGNNEVFGYEKGEEFEAQLGEVEEVRLVKGGHIERIGEFKYEVPDNRAKDSKFDGAKQNAADPDGA